MRLVSPKPIFYGRFLYVTSENLARRQVLALGATFRRSIVKSYRSVGLNTRILRTFSSLLGYLGCRVDINPRQKLTGKSSAASSFGMTVIPWTGPTDPR